MKRTVEPEWLDELPPEDPAAVRSRRDLHRLNRIMGHAETLRQLLQSGLNGKIPKRIVELGAGDGTLMLRLAQQLSSEWKNVTVVLVDWQDSITAETRAGFAAVGWTVEIATADVFDWLNNSANPACDVILANLFLHHFSEIQLTRLFRLAAEKTNLFIACEPRRSTLPLTFSRLVGLIGCNLVTQHDAVLSVRAGFAGRELSALWPSQPHWRLRECSAQLFSHTFVAEQTEDLPVVNSQTFVPSQNI